MRIEVSLVLLRRFGIVAVLASNLWLLALGFSPSRTAFVEECNEGSYCDASSRSKSISESSSSFLTTPSYLRLSSRKTGGDSSWSAFMLSVSCVVVISCAMEFFLGLVGDFGELLK